MAQIINKITENRQTIIASAIGIGTALLIYRMIRGSPRVETPEQRRKRELEILKRNIDVNNVTAEDVKKVLDYSTQKVKAKLAEFNHEFKQNRLKFTRETRRQKISQYLNLLADGLQQLAMIPVREQQDIFHEIGLTQAYLKKYQRQILSSMQDINKQQPEDIAHLAPLSLQDARFTVRQQIQFIKHEGMQYADLIISATKNWPAEKRAQLPMLIPILVLDGAFEGYPQFDEQAVYNAEQLYTKQLMGQMQQLQIAMTPMMLRLNSTLKQVSGFDFSDLHFNGGIGFTPEQAAELKNIQILQQNIKNQAYLNNITQKILG